MLSSGHEAAVGVVDLPFDKLTVCLYPLLQSSFIECKLRVLWVHSNLRIMLG